MTTAHAGQSPDRAPIAESELYARLGVSSAKHEVLASIARAPRGLVPGAFCKVMPDILSGDPDFCVISHADGAGTKSILAYVHYVLNSDPNVFKGIAQDAIVMNLDDMICTGATTQFALTSIVNRNAKRVDATILAALVDGSLEFAQHMTELGIRITHCGGETADLGDIVRTLTVDSVMTARIRRRDVIENNISPGLAIVGLASGGLPATYESSWNSGIGSNGLTFARHVLFGRLLDAESSAQLVDDALDHSATYQGPYRVDDLLAGTESSVLEALLSPTRTFAPVVSAILEERRSSIRGLVHSSGGGQLKCLKFGSGIRYHKDLGSIEMPLFRELQRVSGLSWHELAKVFNLGIRLEVFCQPNAVDEIVKISQEFGVEARLLGETTPASHGTELELKINGETLKFTG